MRRKQGDAASKPLPVYMVSSSDHLTPVDDPANIAVYLRKNGGGEVAAAGTVAAGGSKGWHWWTPAAADLSALGECSVAVTADGCDPFPFAFTVEPSTVADDVAKLALIQAQTASVTINSALPLAGEAQSMSLLRGNEYSAATLQPITFNADDFGSPTSVTFLVSVHGRNKLEIACTVAVVDVDTIAVTVPVLTDSQVDSLPLGGVCDFQFLAKYATTKPRTVRYGTLSVSDVAAGP